MQPRPLIYVSRVTNLSDARYCAGMGVDLLGFNIDPADPDYVSLQAFKEIVGWVSGPRRVVEIGDLAPEKMESVIETYEPEFIHIRERQLPHEGILKIPLLVEVSFNRYQTISQAKDFRRKDIAYWIVDQLPAELASIDHGDSVIVSSHAETGSVISLVKRGIVGGISLQGSREASPGLKDYDHLSRILEEFEN